MDFKQMLRNALAKKKDDENDLKKKINNDEECNLFFEYYNKWKKNNQSKYLDHNINEIPRFYFKINQDDVLSQKLREEARAAFLERRGQNLLVHSELRALWILLDKHQSPPLSDDEQLINYEDFKKVIDEAGPKYSIYLNPSIFAKLQFGDPYGRINILALFNYVMRKVWYHQTRIGLSLYDVIGQGYLREIDLENYIYELIPTLPQLEGLEKSFHHFYVCTAVRKFLFFLDPLHTGKVKILDVLSCSFLDDLLELRDKDLPKDSQNSNWFSAPSALRVYGRYLNLDKDHNGMLNKEELSGYGTSTLTPVFMDRVFQECLTYEGEMDYKTYLDFVLAMENRHEPQSLLYLFRILDINNKGYLDAFSLHYFFRAIQEQMLVHGQDPISFDDVKDEIFDMVKPVNPFKITLQDLLKCGQGDTMITILIDLNGFWTYENRELGAESSNESSAEVFSLVLDETSMSESTSTFSLFLSMKQWSSWLRLTSEDSKQPDLKSENVKIKYRDDLPWYTHEDIIQHNCYESGIWTSFRGGVYNITNCIDSHPGGLEILLAAGKPLEEFFDAYQIHLQQDSTALTMLEECRIGNIATDNNNNNIKDCDQMDKTEYVEDKCGRKYLTKKHTEKPFNGEAPVKELKKYWITPTELFYIRNHHPVPKIDPSTYYFEIKGIGVEKSIRITLNDLYKLPKTEYVCTFQCAGNRRKEMSNVIKICGPQWDLGGISNAIWGGVLLTDLLKSIDCDISNPDIKHIIFTGYDGKCPANYEVAIPSSKAFDTYGDVLVAYEMNQKPLTPDHGFPVRIVVPGHAGARSCKWLASIELSFNDSESHWQKYDFKFFPPNIRSRDNVKNWDEIPPIQELPVYSSFMSPEDAQLVQTINGKLKCEGYAWSGAGRKVIRVEVSLDNGDNWLSANLTKTSGAPARRDWCWTFWEIDIPIESQKTKEIDLCVRAVDSSYNIQPKDFKDIWNFCGIACNAWHRIKVILDE